jgi:hypothetical protein
MSLPSAWTDKIFTKLTLAYGRDFLSRWEGIDLSDVKTDWSHELSGFDAHPEAIAYALANLPPKPPSVIEFRAIARRAPQADAPRLEAPKADPAKVAAEIAKQTGLREALAPKHNPKEWAQRLDDRAAAGDRIRPITLKFAREALGMEGKMPWQ